MIKLLNTYANHADFYYYLCDKYMYDNTNVPLYFSAYEAARMCSHAFYETLFTQAELNKMSYHSKLWIVNYKLHHNYVLGCEQGQEETKLSQELEVSLNRWRWVQKMEAPSSWLKKAVNYVRRIR